MWISLSNRLRIHLTETPAEHVVLTNELCGDGGDFFGVRIVFGAGETKGATLNVEVEDT